MILICLKLQCTSKDSFCMCRLDKTNQRRAECNNMKWACASYSRIGDPEKLWSSQSFTQFVIVVAHTVCDFGTLHILDQRSTPACDAAFDPASLHLTLCKESNFSNFGARRIKKARWSCWKTNSLQLPHLEPAFWARTQWWWWPRRFGQVNSKP